MKKLFVLIFVFTVFQVSFITAQNDKTTAVEISKGKNIKYLKVSKKVKLNYEADKISGEIDSISPQSIFINNEEYHIDKIESINIKFQGTQIAGGIIGGGGLVITGFGTYLILDGLQKQDLGGAFEVVFGVIVDVIGIPILTIGSALLFIGKKYKKTKGWKYKTVQLE